MFVDELSHVKPDVDLDQVPPIQQKRILALINHFVRNTVSHLNNFCESCESKLMRFEYKMQELEAAVLILEAQLSSIPGVNESQKTADIINQTHSLPEINNHSQEKNMLANNTTEHTATTENPILQHNEKTGVKASEHTIYGKYFKMLRVGVHELAVKQKMQSEGIDPTILNDPEAIIPDEQE